MMGTFSRELADCPSTGGTLQKRVTALAWLFAVTTANSASRSDCHLLIKKRARDLQDTVQSLTATNNLASSSLQDT